MDEFILETNALSDNKLPVRPQPKTDWVMLGALLILGLALISMLGRGEK